MIDLFDTIVAPATVLGESAIAIVRLSGPRSAEILSRFVSLVSGRRLADVTPRTLVSCVVWNDSEIVDHALCVRFRAPSSYTGEELFELHLHGNPVIVDLVLRLSVGGGARLATAGEFSRRALVNGKLDLTQVEGLAASLRAESETALYLSQRQLHGQLSAMFSDVRATFVRLLGLLELELDFSEDGYHFADRSELRAVVDSVLVQLESLAVSFHAGERLRRGPRVLLVGLPNSGKSSLFNACVGFARALVSPVAGTTRDYVEEKISHDGVIVHLVDTAGLRDTADPMEAAGVLLGRGLIDVVDRVLFLVDSSVDSVSAEELFDELSANSSVVITKVFTKIDIGSSPSGELACSVLDPVSIRRLLDDIVATSSVDVSASLLLLTRRQFDLVSQLIVSVRSADWGAQDPEILSFELRRLLFFVDELSGAICSEDVLNEIFSAFCIGK